MTYQQYVPPPSPPVVKSGGLAVSALVLGIVGVVLSFVPILNNVSAAGAFVGLVLGVIGIFRSHKVMATVGAGLCVLAVVLTVLAQQRLGEELDELGQPERDAVASTSTPSTTLPRPTVEPAKYVPKATDWKLDVVVTEQQCFGSAGCNVTLRVELTYLGTLETDASTTYELVYDVVGTEDSLRGSTQVTGDRYSTRDHFVSTPGPDVALTAKVVSFEELY